MGCHSKCLGHRKVGMLGRPPLLVPAVAMQEKRNKCRNKIVRDRRDRNEAGREFMATERGEMTYMA